MLGDGKQAEEPHYRVPSVPISMTSNNHMEPDWFGKYTHGGTKIQLAACVLNSWTTLERNRLKVYLNFTSAFLLLEFQILEWVMICVVASQQLRTGATNMRLPNFNMMECESCDAVFVCSTNPYKCIFTDLSSHRPHDPTQPIHLLDSSLMTSRSPNHRIKLD